MAYYNNSNSIYAKAAKLKAERKLMEERALEAERNRTDEENAALEQKSYADAISSQRKDTHSMQYSFYSRKS